MAAHTADKVTPEALVDLPVPQDVRISPDGIKVVYSVSPNVAFMSSVKRTGEHMLSSLWIADVGKTESARQITSGHYNDQSPQWCPDISEGYRIAFISDRGIPGESSAVYVLSLDGGEAYPVTKADNKKAIADFKWGPNGKFIAFLSPDEKSEEQIAQEKETGGAEVYGEAWEFNRVRCLHLSTREVETLYDGKAHVMDFAWNEDGTEIIFVSHRTPDLSSAGYHGVEVCRISLATKSTSSVGKQRFPGFAKNLIWLGDSAYFLAGAAPDKACTSKAVYRMAVESGKWTLYGHGVDNCAVSLRKSGNFLFIHALSGLYDEICVWEIEADKPFESVISIQSQITVFDVTSSNATQKWIITFIKSDCKTPSEVYYCTDSAFVSKQSDSTYRLSNHGQSIAKMEIGNHTPVYSIAKDGTECDGILVRPNSVEKRPMPSVVLVHGGPYDRISNAFNLLYFYWGPYIVASGYTLLCPNYRGGSSHGEKYASQARGAMGTNDYDDVVSLLKEAIAQGFVDENRVIIGGYSQGGFMTNLAVTRQDFRFKAAISGAGVSDWDAMCMTSDAPWFEAEASGKAPWQTTADDIKARHGSPIWHMKNVKTPMLILHGEEDARVPFSQGVALHRGYLHYNVPCEFVAYPREGHVIKEREHLIDMLKRIRRFCDLHLQ